MESQENLFFDDHVEEVSATHEHEEEAEEEVPQEDRHQYNLDRPTSVLRRGINKLVDYMSDPLLCVPLTPSPLSVSSDKIDVALRRHRRRTDAKRHAAYSAAEQKRRVYFSDPGASRSMCVSCL
jgi:hypothetical protein